MATEKEEKTTANWMKEAQKGYIRIGVLILLNKKPSHGYEIMKEIKAEPKASGNPLQAASTQSSVTWKNQDISKGEWQNQKNSKIKVYKITESGRTYSQKSHCKTS